VFGGGGNVEAFSRARLHISGDSSTAYLVIPIDSERGIAWRLADSLALRQFLQIGLDERTPDHSTISRTRRLIDLETHRKVFGWVLGLLADRGLRMQSGLRAFLLPRGFRDSYQRFSCAVHNLTYNKEVGFHINVDGVWRNIYTSYSHSLPTGGGWIVEVWKVKQFGELVKQIPVTTPTPPKPIFQFAVFYHNLDWIRGIGTTTMVRTASFKRFDSSAGQRGHCRG
jgi:hypothetical protein